MNNILLRAITGSVFISLIIGSLWWNNITTLIIMSLFLTLGLIEFFKLFKENKNISISIGIALTGNLLIFAILIGTMLEIIPGKTFSLIFPILFLVFLWELPQKIFDKRIFCFKIRICLAKTIFLIHKMLFLIMIFAFNTMVLNPL